MKARCGRLALPLLGWQRLQTTRGADHTRHALRALHCWVQGAQQKQPPNAPVKMSTATKAHLAWPCLPVLEVDTSTT